MEIFNLEETLNLFGMQVPTFPRGIKEAFDKLIAMVPDGMERNHYGISYMEGDKVIYYVATTEKFPGEADKFNCTKYKIEKGDYLAVTLKDWMKKTDSIKNVFHKMMQDKRVDVSKPCVEWYKTEDEMMCMMKMVS